MDKKENIKSIPTKSHLDGNFKWRKNRHSILQSIEHPFPECGSDFKGRAEDEVLLLVNF